jgi:hypothetical protein
MLYCIKPVRMLRVLIACLATCTLIACGGGSSGVAPAPTTTSVDGIVQDGSGGAASSTGSGSTTSTLGNGCFDASSATRPTTRFEYVYTNPPSSSYIVNSLVIESMPNALASFNGSGTYNNDTSITTQVVTNAGRRITTVVSNTSFELPSSVGDETQILMDGMLDSRYFSITKSFDFGDGKRMDNLVLGDEFVVQDASTVTFSILGGASSNLVSSSVNRQRFKFLAKETIVVPGGTFETCKLETQVTQPYSPDVATTWLAVGKGFVVKTITSNAPGLVQEFKQGTYNGVAL